MLALLVQGAENMSLLSEIWKLTDHKTGKEAPKVSNCVIQDSCQQTSKG